jgi:hypothetical protein
MNTLSFRKAIQWTFAGVLVAAGVGFLYGAVFAAPGEPPGCANQTCKEITYPLTCDMNKAPMAGRYYDQGDCTQCSAVLGRCQNGTTKACNGSDAVLKDGPADVAEICLCSKAPASGVVEAQLIKTTGALKDNGLKRSTCAK